MLRASQHSRDQHSRSAALFSVQSRLVWLKARSCHAGAPQPKDRSQKYRMKEIGKHHRPIIKNVAIRSPFCLSIRWEAKAATTVEGCGLHGGLGGRTPYQWGGTQRLLRPKSSIEFKVGTDSCSQTPAAGLGAADRRRLNVGNGGATVSLPAKRCRGIGDFITHDQLSQPQKNSALSASAAKWARKCRPRSDPKSRTRLPERKRNDQALREKADA